MYLEQIIIKNFRLFEALDLKLNSGLNILVGENDAGKTALIDSIRHVLGTNSSDRIYLTEDDFYSDANSLLIQLKFVDVEKYGHIFVEHLTHEEFEVDGIKKRKPVLYIQLIAAKTEKEKRGYPFIKTEIKSGKDGNGLTLEFEIRDFLSTTYLKPLRDAEAELSSGKGSRLSQILSSSSELKNLESVVEILGHIAEANSKLLEVGKPINITSKKIQNEYLHNIIFEKDKDLLSAIIDIAGIKKDDLLQMNDSQKRKHLRSVLEGLKLSLSGYRKHGLGYNNLLFMAAELLLLEQELDEEFSLLLIEEPEAHLHPQLQMKLLQFIVGKSKAKKIPGAIQCILTTHSPNISSKSNPANIIIMSKGKSFSLRQEETELDSDDYKFLEKFLDVTKANLFFASGVILVEGDGENILLPTIAKILGKPLEDYGVSLVKYDNSGSWKRFVKIFLRKGKDDQPKDWNPIKISVLRDLDLWPLCAEEYGENLYGFKEKKVSNSQYWEKSGNDLICQINEKKQALKIDKSVSLEKQNIKILISDRWTFEFCLARFGLFKECYEALNGSLDGIEKVQGSDDEKATYVQSKVSKTDFAYKMAEILERDYINKIPLFKSKLPTYIVEAIEHVTSPILDNNIEGGKDDSSI